MNEILQGDSLEVLKTLPSESVDCVITSPPYWALRDYGVEGQLGLEPTFQEYITKLCDMFDEVKRVLKKEGTCWVNLGDTYMGNSSYSEKGRQGFGNDKIGMINKKQWLDPKYPHKEKLRAREHVESGQIIEKSLCQIPSRFSLEMTNRDWILRNEIIWHKPNCMPSSATYRDRNMRPNPDGKNKRCVWAINTKPLKETHFATFPEKLIEPMILAGCPKGGVVLDIFMGAGTTAVVAKKLGRNYLGIELNPEYITIANDRIRGTIKPLF